MTRPPKKCAGFTNGCICPACLTMYWLKHSNTCTTGNVTGAMLEQLYGAKESLDDTKDVS